MEFLAALTWSKVFGGIGKAFSFCLAHWRETLIVLLAVLAFHFHSSSVDWHGKADDCAVARKADKAAFEKAGKDAEAKNKREALAAETRWKGVAEETKIEYDKSLKTAYAAVADYARRMRSSTGGDAGEGFVPSAPDPAQGVDGPGTGALVPVPVGDLNVCAANTVKAQKWQYYWKGVVAGWPRAE